jgi:hypothetical protein
MRRGNVAGFVFDWLTEEWTVGERRNSGYNLIVAFLDDSVVFLNRQWEQVFSIPGDWYGASILNDKYCVNML